MPILVSCKNNDARTISQSSQSSKNVLTDNTRFYCVSGRQGAIMPNAKMAPVESRLGSRECKTGLSSAPMEVKNSDNESNPVRLT